MRKKKVTMSDIATEAGVSQPTVSAILNGSDSIKVSEATRIKVLNKARELGYALKQNIRHSNMHPRIALVVNSLNMHDPFINAVSAAKTRAWELDYLLVVFDYEEDEELKQAIFSEIKEDDYQGMIFASNTPKSISPLDDAPQIPTVMLNCFCDVPSTITAVVAADFLGGYRATDHLISRNYRYIAMITGESWSESSIQRQKGYQQALVNADIPANPDWIVEGNWSVKQSYLETLRLLELTPRPDAIFCASDLMAVGCYQAIAKKGLTIPDDIAVMGYDNQLLASELTPGLSSIDLPYDEMGRKAVELICKVSPEEALPLIKIEGELYIREST